MKGKEVTSRLEIRENALKTLGKDRFEVMKQKDPMHWGALDDIPIPQKYVYIWNIFLAVWRQCGVDFYGNRIISAREIEDYLRFVGKDFRICEKRMIMHIRDWAMETVAEVRETAKENEKTAARKGKR